MPKFSPAFRVLGALEERVMRIAWDADSPILVREVAERLGDTHAYTTVMTTMDRLYKKGLLARELDGIAYRYWPALSRDDYHRRVVEEAVAGLIASSAGSVVAAFVDTAVELDADNLGRIERAIAKYKSRSR